MGRNNDIRNLIIDIQKIKNKNKVITLLGSGGIGKTTIIKKIANIFSSRGYFLDGLSFIDCEYLKDYLDFEEKVRIVLEVDNAMDFKNQLSLITGKDRFIVLDNFETLLCLDTYEETKNIKELLFELTKLGVILITSREKIDVEFEDIYTLDNLNLNDAELLYKSIHNKDLNPKDRNILRTKILENTLNKNPLAIKLVAKLKLSINTLVEELSDNFFELTEGMDIDNIDSEVKKVFSKESDFNIEKSKSLFYSISLSFERLKNNHKLMIKLLSLFPDGIHKKNFITFYNKKELKFLSHRITYKDITQLEDKSLIIVSNEFIKLQSIIGRFAEYKFLSNAEEDAHEYYKRAFDYNCFLLKKGTDLDSDINKRSSLILFNKNKNNFLKCLDYMIDLSDNEKLIEFIHSLVSFLSFNTVHDAKILKKFEILYDNAKNENYKQFILLIILKLEYFYGNFDFAFDSIKKEFPYESIFDLKYSDNSERKMYLSLENIYSMEGYDNKILAKIISSMQSNHFKLITWKKLINIGAFNIIEKIRDNRNFQVDRNTFKEYDYMYNSGILDIDELIKYRNSLHKNELLEYVQATYVLFKVKPSLISIEDIEKLIFTNDFTHGLKLLMLALKDEDSLKSSLFEKAIIRMSHIKYYYIEAILFYSKVLKKHNHRDYYLWFERGKKLAEKHKYNYLSHKYLCLEESKDIVYNENSYNINDVLNYKKLLDFYKIKI